jgi:hypothetical protein
MGNYMRRVFAIYMQRRQVEQSYRLLWQTVHDTPPAWPALPDWMSLSAQDQLRRAYAFWLFGERVALPPTRAEIRLSPAVEYLLHQTYAPPALTVSPASTPDNWPAIIDYYQHLLGEGGGTR